MPGFAYEVGELADGEQVGVAEESHSVVEREALAVLDPFYDRFD